jgi:hypothetical protein
MTRVIDKSLLGIDQSRLSPAQHWAYFLLCQQDRIATQLARPEMRQAVRQVLHMIQDLGQKVDLV